MPLADPHGWQTLTFGDKDAFTDFLGAHALSHRALDDVIRRKGAAPYAVLPLGDGPQGQGDDWHRSHQDRHVGEAAGLAITGPANFTSYDLRDGPQFASWAWLHALEHARLNKAAGL